MEWNNFLTICIATFHLLGTPFVFGTKIQFTSLPRSYLILSLVENKSLVIDSALVQICLR